MIFLQELCKQNLGEEGYKYFPFALGLFTTIGACNVANLLPYVEMPTQVRSRYFIVDYNSTILTKSLKTNL